MPVRKDIFKKKTGVCILLLILLVDLNYINVLLELRSDQLDVTVSSQASLR
ncbi:MAG: hypothetical protein ACI90V_000156, partial [Bacillariaceae sp.]